MKLEINTEIGFLGIYMKPEDERENKSNEKSLYEHEIMCY